MAGIFMYTDHLMLLTDSRNPEAHKHLASHIIISTGEKMCWSIDGEEVKARGICIGSDVLHKSEIFNDEIIVFLFDEISGFSLSLNEKYLKNKPYAVLDDEIVDKVVEIYKSKKDLDKRILQVCGIKNVKRNYDDRIQEVLDYIKKAETIESDIVDKLCVKVFLSKSRLSHLFHSETSMTLHSYLSLEKLKKTYFNLQTGMNITESCMKAGFDSPSHCAATCKKMCGMSLSDLKK